MAMQASIREITDAELATIVSGQQSRAVVVEFWATWCGACRRLAPVLESLATEFGEQVEIVKVNADQSPVAVGRFDVTSTPTMIAFVGGEPVATMIGAQPEPSVRAWLGEVLASAGPPTQRASLWAPVDACTLPTAEQPLRKAEFAGLFSAALRGVQRVSPTLLHLELDATAESTARGPGRA
ncbi:MULTISPECIES: thioredoxin family protein [Nocardia]|uniref:thioredoxin family protein n=1 Tax=Nocardia TaxID=1817 RepID=UPI0002DD2B00|nr:MULTISPECIES: thioredoxin family protein [Nocardia]